jgi:hypothetical protein
MTTVLTRPSARPVAPSGPGAPTPTMTPRGGVLGPSIATALAVLLASVSIGPLIDTGAWTRVTTVVIVVVVAVGGVATRLRVPVFLIPILQAGALFATLVGAFTTDAPLGFFPSPDALSELRAVLADGMTGVDQYAPPVPLTDGISALIALGVGCVAIVVFVLAVDLRMPVAAGAGLVAIYVVPSFVLDDGSPWWAFVAVAVGWMLLLISDERVGLVAWGRLLRRSEGSPSSPLAGLSSAGLRLGVVALVVSVLVPILIPSLADAVLGRNGAGTGTGTAGADGASQLGLDPFVDLRKKLVEQGDTPVLHYTTATKSPSYLPTVILEDYQDEKWRARVFTTDAAVQVSDGATIAPSGPATGVKLDHYQLAVDKLVNEYLPLPERTQTVTGLRGDWFADKTTGTVFGAPGSGTSTRGVTWEVDAVADGPSAADLNAQPSGSDGRQPDAEQARLIGSVPAALAATAQTVTKDATTPYAKAIALQKWFLANFQYSTEVSADQSVSALQQFLTERRGYCQQFAATFALMGRALGMSTRVVVGYTQGTQNTDGSWSVLSKDAHAWPEVSFGSLGWVRFEPTPRGAADGGTLTTPPNAQGVPQAAPEPSTSATPSSSSDVSTKLKNLEPADRAAGAAPFDGPAVETTTSADAWRLRAILLVLLVGAGLALIPALRRWARRRRRLAPDASVEDAWDELRDSARDLGVSWSDSMTPRQAVAAVISRQYLRGDVAAAATRVGRTTELSRYAPTPPSTDGLADDVTAVRTALLDRVDRSTRIRALLMPASLRRGD